MPSTTMAGSAIQMFGREDHHHRHRRMRQRAADARTGRGRSARASAGSTAPRPRRRRRCRPASACRWPARRRACCAPPAAAAPAAPSTAGRRRRCAPAPTRMRGDCITCCQPTRIAPTKRSPGSVLVRGCERQRRIGDEGHRRQQRVEHEDRAAAHAGQDGAGHHRADDARQVHRDAVQRHRRAAGARAAPPRARWPRTPASASPGRCRWRRSAPAAAARSASRSATARPAAARSAPPTAAWPRSSGAGR